MKKILMLCLALVMGVGMCAAQKAADKKTVTTVFTTDIDCEHCVKKIMNNVPSLGKGVKDVKVDLPKKEVTVVYDSAKNSDENIVKGFASIKVKAEPKKAGAKKSRRRVLLLEREDTIVLPFVSVVGRAPVLPSVSPPRSAIHCPLSTVCCLPYDSGRQPIRAGACRTTAGMRSACPESARLPVCPVYRCGCPFVFMALCLRLRR